jgi:D-amino-acid oxidase
LVELAAGSRSASSFAVPVIDTSVYLNYVHDLLRSRQVQFVSSDLSSLEEALAWAPSIVNCSGVGAIQLAKDSDLHPARGQIVRIKRRPDHAGFVDLTQEPAIAHVTPRTHDTVLGGTYEANVSTLAPDWDEAARTLERCQAICPALASISLEDVLGISCGLRPVRSSVRVEAEHVNGHPIVHNYGHGGAGFTLAWGCAEEVCLLLDKAVQQSV